MSIDSKYGTATAAATTTNTLDLEPHARVKPLEILGKSTGRSIRSLLVQLYRSVLTEELHSSEPGTTGCAGGTKSSGDHESL